MSDKGPSMGEYEEAVGLDPAGELFDEASQIADAEASDLPALLADIHQAREALASAYNRLARSVDPSLCVVQGRIETAQETIDVAADLVNGLIK